MYFVNIIYSQKLNKYYIGFTADINDRLSKHNSKSKGFSNPGRPWQHVYSIKYLAVPALRKTRIYGRSYLITFHRCDNIIFYYFCNMNEKLKPIFNKRIFRDVNFEQIDYDVKANFVIERVFERGDVEDIRQCRRYYGDEKVTEALLQAKFLPEHRMHLASAVIDKPLNEFRCYILRQSNPGFFPY